MDYSEAIIKTFLEKVDRRGPDECWPWRGNRNHNGYGRVYCKEVGQKYRGHKAHRVSLFIKTGSMGDGLLALHSCDNPPCCNPNHLRWGTRSENTKDVCERNPAFLAGIRARMSKIGQSQGRRGRSITMRQARKLREVAAKGYDVKECAELMGIRLAHARRIIRGDRYAK